MPQKPAVDREKAVRMPSYKVDKDKLRKAQEVARSRNTAFSIVLRRFIARYAAGEVK